jgi:mono/diheme cytochrome c family protein
MGHLPDAVTLYIMQRHRYDVIYMKTPGVWRHALLVTVLTLGPAIGFCAAQDALRIHGVDGPEIFKNHCATCHGSDGRGHGPVAADLKHTLPDLTTLTARNGGKFPLERVKQVIEGQAETPAAHGTREMPVWGPVFHEIDFDRDLGNVRMDAITKYLESLQKK